jgi:hypothetical protein
MGIFRQPTAFSQSSGTAFRFMGRPKYLIQGLFTVDFKLILCVLTIVGRMVEAASVKPLNLRIGTLLCSALAFAPLAAAAQEAAPTTKQGHTEQQAVTRDKEKEDQVAKLFEGIRADAKLPKLERIRHRADLEQGVCTSALTGQPSKQGAASYMTGDPESITPELKSIAASNRLDPHNKPWYARYSVAVWRVKDSQSGKVAYRVGVGLYETGLAEFVDCHFTDDVHYCGKWKESVAPPCRGR